MTGLNWDVSWKVQALDALADGTDITAQLFGAGWHTPTLQPGEAVELRITAGSRSPEGWFWDAPVTVRSDTDNGVVDSLSLSATPAWSSTTPFVDAQVRNAGESSYSGVDLYEINPYTQRRTQWVAAPDAPAVYHIRLHNAGAQASTYRVRGAGASDGGGGGGWAVAYYDALQEGADITADVTGDAGWTTPSIAAHGTYDLRVEVAATGEATPGALQDLLVSAAWAGEDVDVEDVVKLRTVAQDRVDLLIRRQGDAAYVGGGISSGDATAQRESQTKTGTAAVYDIKVLNAGAFGASRVKITGPGDDEIWTVRYFDALADGNDITAQVTGSGWTTPELDGKTPCEIRLEVTPLATAEEGLTRDVTVQGKSVVDVSQVDTVRASTVTTAPSQPDVMIYPVPQPGDAGDGAYIGGGTINDDATDQVASTLDVPNRRQLYNLKIKNVISAEETQGAAVFRIKAPTAASGWTVRYFDKLGDGNDITAQVNGTGWPTPALHPDESVEIRVEVTPATSVADDAILATLVTAVAQSDATKLDVVKATTKRIRLMVGIEYSLDQGQTWQAAPGAGGDPIELMRRHTLGLRAVKNPDYLDVPWSFDKPAWEFESKHLQGVEVWVAYETVSATAHPLTGDCGDAYETRVLCVTDPDHD